MAENIQSQRPTAGQNLVVPVVPDARLELAHGSGHEDTATANLPSALETAIRKDCGAGGRTKTEIRYSLSIIDVLFDSGLKHDGVTIILSEGEAGDILGNADDKPVFRLHVNGATGEVTLTRYAPIDRPLPGANANSSARLLTLGKGVISLDVDVKITGPGGDWATKSCSVDLGGLVGFHDDGPSLRLGRINTQDIELFSWDAGTAGGSARSTAQTDRPPPVLPRPQLQQGNTSRWRQFRIGAILARRAAFWKPSAM